MKQSLERFLQQTATRGSWYGGGSAAAMTCALAAALLEKLVNERGVAASVRRLRREATVLIERDATAFARVIQAYYQHDQPAIQRALKAAIDVPLSVHAASDRLLQLAAKARTGIRPRYRVDLTCAVALARASRQTAGALVRTNLTWLADRAYSRRILAQLRRA